MSHRALLVLSPYQAEPLLRARDAARSEVRMTPDLGLSEVDVQLNDTGVCFPDGEVVRWPDLEMIRDSKRSGRLTGHCYVIENGTPREISVFSQENNRIYSLMPTHGAPTLLISSIPMHRIKGTDPFADTVEKIRAAAPVIGNVLDTTTGLGYTAIQAARTASAVTTIELDPAVLEVARENPWSRDLFENPRIRQLVGDSAEVVAGLPDAAFDRIIHDPPTFSLAGELYGSAFYRELHRVLKPRGRLFHYIGNPESNLGGKVSRGVIRRLHETGFSRVVGKPEAFGVLAHK